MRSIYEAGHACFWNMNELSVLLTSTAVVVQVASSVSLWYSRVESQQSAPGVELAALVLAVPCCTVFWYIHHNVTN